MLYLDFSFLRVLNFAWKCPKKEFFLVRIFPHSNWIRRDTLYHSVFSPNAVKYGPEKTPYLDTFHTVAGTARTSERELRKNKLQLQAYFVSNTFISNARLKLAENQASKLSNTLWLNCCYLKIIRFLHPRYH